LPIFLYFDVLIIIIDEQVNFASQLMDANNTLSLSLEKNFLARKDSVLNSIIYFIFNYIIILYIYRSIINNIVKFYYNIFKKISF